MEVWACGANGLQPVELICSCAQGFHVAPRSRTAKCGADLPPAGIPIGARSVLDHSYPRSAEGPGTPQTKIVTARCCAICGISGESAALNQDAIDSFPLEVGRARLAVFSKGRPGDTEFVSTPGNHRDGRSGQPYTDEDSEAQTDSRGVHPCHVRHFSPFGGGAARAPRSRGLHL